MAREFLPSEVVNKQSLSPVVPVDMKIYEKSLRYRDVLHLRDIRLLLGSMQIFLESQCGSGVGSLVYPGLNYHVFQRMHKKNLEGLVDLVM